MQCHRHIELKNTTMNPENLSFEVLKEITDDFSKERKLGQGTYGGVYEGKLKNGDALVVKMFSTDGQGLNPAQFLNVFRTRLRLQHTNIVRLVGYCNEKQYSFNKSLDSSPKVHAALCFEYWPHGSLQKHISDECDGLQWDTRFKIIKGTCEGLKYLQDELKDSIYYLDINPDNIILDLNMEAKLADFGLLKLFGEGQNQTLDKTDAAPEYIFKLGVVMMKILAGLEGYSRSCKMPPQELIDLIERNWRDRLQATCTRDPTIRTQCQQVKRCTEIALDCMHIDRKKRPGIANIILKLNETEMAIDKLRKDNMTTSVDKVASTIVSKGITPEGIANDTPKGNPSHQEAANASPQPGANKESEDRTNEMSSSSSKELIQVEPPQLCFPLENKRASCSVKLLNNTDDHVAVFWWAIDTAALYEGEWIGGILLPYSVVELILTRKAQEDQLGEADCSDKIILCSTIVDEGLRVCDVTRDMFKIEAAGLAVNQLELDVVLVTPPTPPVSPPEPLYYEEALRIFINELQSSSETSKELIKFYPLVIPFPFEPNKVVARSALLLNNTDDYTAFILKMSCNTAEYDFKPRKGIMAPRSTKEVVVINKAQTQTPPDMAVNAVIHVLSTVVEEGFKYSEITDDIFQIQQGRIVQEALLRIAVVRPSQQHTLPSIQDYHEELKKLHLSAHKPEVDTNYSNQGVMRRPILVNGRIMASCSLEMHPTEPWILVNQGDGHVLLWDYQTQDVTTVQISIDDVDSAIFIARKQWIVAGGDCVIYVYSDDLTNKIHELREPSGSVNSLALHPFEPYLLSGVADRKIIMRDYEKDWEIIKVFEVSDCLYMWHVAFYNSMGTQFVATTAKHIKIMDLYSSRCAFYIPAHSYGRTDYFRRGPDELYMIVGHGLCAEIWDCETRDIIKTLEGHTKNVSAVLCHPDISILITGSDDGAVRLWNSNTLRHVATLNCGLGNILCLACLKGSTSIVIGCVEGLVLTDIDLEVNGYAMGR